MRKQHSALVHRLKTGCLYYRSRTSFLKRSTGAILNLFLLRSHVVDNVNAMAQVTFVTERKSCNNR